MNPAYLNQVAERADEIAHRATTSHFATGNMPSKHTAELARIVVALAAHIRDAERAEQARVVAAPWWRRRRRAA